MWRENKHGDPTFYYVFNISLSCNINIPSFIGNLRRVLLLGNHLKRPSHGKLKLVNSCWCALTAQKQAANTFANCWRQIETCLPTVFMSFTHSNLSMPTRVCQLKFAVRRPLYRVFCGTNSPEKDHLSCSERTSEINPDLRERLMYIAGKKEKANARC